jgi:DNA-3-methyladenine glycosylase I
MLEGPGETGPAAPPVALFSLAVPPRELLRCRWAADDPLMIRYHDEEWGVPVHDDRRLFEMLILEGAQAGLSWMTILRKRAGYRRAFDCFDPRRVARYGARQVQRLLADEGIVRNRLKIESTITNARALLDVQQKEGSFDAFVWSFVGGRPRVNRPRTLAEIPARTPESDALSKALKKQGFRFVGSTIVYAFMQACGLVDDHERRCFKARGPSSGARRPRQGSA